MLISDFFCSPEGILERPVVATSWPLPGGLAIDGPYLSWDGQILRQVEPGRGMLEGFIALHGAEDKAILRYAQKWGNLSPRNVRTIDRDKPGSTDWSSGTEFLSTWRETATRFSTALSIASTISKRQRVTLDDWAILLGIPRSELNGDEEIENMLSRRDPAIDSGPELQSRMARWAIARILRRDSLPVEVERWALFFEINQWAENASVGFWLDPWNNRLQVRTDTLYCGLCWQLMAAVCSSGGFAVCSECGKTFKPSRKPGRDTRTYCSRCVNEGVPRRNATRAWRERTKKQEGERNGEETR